MVKQMELVNSERLITTTTMERWWMIYSKVSALKSCRTELSIQGYLLLEKRDRMELFSSLMEIYIREKFPKTQLMAMVD